MQKNKKLPKMLIVFWGVPFGGIDTYLKSLIPGLLDQYNIVLASANPDKNLIGSDVKNYYVPFQNWMLGLWVFYLIRIIIKERISILFTQEIVLSVICRYLKVFFPRLKHFSVIHSDIRHFNQYSGLFIKILLLINRITSFLINKYICDSEYLVKGYLLSEGISKKQIEVIYPGRRFLSSEEIIPQKRAGNLWKVGFIGRFNYEKGFDIFIEIAKRMISEQNNYQFHAAGEGKYCIDEAKAVETKFPENFRLHGYIENVKEFYGQMDCVLVPSRTEGFCYILLEAFNLGVPVICSDSGSLPELVGNEKAAIICKTGDIDAFIAAIMSLKNDAGLKKEITSNAKRRAYSFSLEKMHKNYLKALVGC